jgi:hypothetical protein
MSEYTPATLRTRLHDFMEGVEWVGTVRERALVLDIGRFVIQCADAWEALEKRMEAARNMLKRADAIIALYAYDSGVKVRMGRALHDSSIAWLAEYAREGS